MSARSYLYAPLSNERILAKVLSRGADAIVLDLEDGVAAADKDRAREALSGFLDGLPDARPRILVRINRDGEGWSEADLDAAVRAGVDELSLPKAESATAVAAVADQIQELEVAGGLDPGSIGLHLLLESAAGVTAVETLAQQPRVRRFGIGAADLAADLGILGTPHPNALDHVRGRVVLASRAAGIEAPVDAVHTDLDDLDGLEAAAVRARGFGFGGKSAVHPAQVEVINRVFLPSDDEIAWARRVVEAATNHADGAIRLDGDLIDAPIVSRARALLSLVSEA